MSLIRSIKLVLQATKFFLTTLPLQCEIRRFTRQWNTVINAHPTVLDMDRLRTIEDEIFGRKIESECLQLKAWRLTQQARGMRYKL